MTTELLGELKHIHRIYTQQFPKDRWSKEFKEQVKIDFTYFSSKLEGLKLTYGDTLTFLKTGVIHRKEPIVDIFSVKNHKEILDTIFESFDSFELTEKAIKKINFELLQDPFQRSVSDVLKPPGEYRDSAASGIWRKGHKEYLDQIRIPSFMQKLVHDFNEKIALLQGSLKITWFIFLPGFTINF